MSPHEARLALIVEGHGDVSATPILVRRLLESQPVYVHVLPAHRVPKTRMRQDLGRAVRLQSDRVGHGLGGVLVLVDADSDDPAQLENELAQLVDVDIREGVRICIAVKEYEAWFLAGVESLRTHRSVQDDATFEGDPEGPRDAKGRLAALMTESYQETIHQASFSALVDTDLARARSASFANFAEQLDALIRPDGEAPVDEQSQSNS